MKPHKKKNALKRRIAKTTTTAAAGSREIRQRKLRLHCVIFIITIMQLGAKV